MQICFLLYQGSLCPSLENYSISTHPHILALPPHFFLIWTHGTPTVSCWIECPHKRPFSIATDRLLKRKKEETEVDPFFQQMLSRYCCYWEQNWNYMQLSLWQWSLFWTQAVKASRPGVSPGFPEWPPAADDRFSVFLLSKQWSKLLQSSRFNQHKQLQWNKLLPSDHNLMFQSPERETKDSKMSIRRWNNKDSVF